MGQSRATVALVTSGLGPRNGGIGVVSESLRVALSKEARVVVWAHRHRWPLLGRLLGLSVAVMKGMVWRRPHFVLYEHVALAQAHRLFPLLRGLPYGVFLHGTEVWRALPARQRRALEQADLLLVNSANTETVAREFNPWLPKCSVVWLGVPVPSTPPSDRIRPPLALVVSQVRKDELYKGHQAVLDAWPELKRQIPDARLVIIGGGDALEELRGRLVSAKLEGVELRGHVSDAERDALYRESRLLLFPSTREGFGLVAVEAAAWGTPVLAVGTGVVRELFEDSDGVVLASVPTGAAVAEAALPVLRDPAEAARRGRAAWSRVQERFREEQFHERVRRACAPWLASHRALRPVSSWR